MSEEFTEKRHRKDAGAAKGGKSFTAKLAKDAEEEKKPHREGNHNKDQIKT